MNKYILYIFIAIFAIVSCAEEAVPKPDNLLSKEQMVEILYDITLVNSIKGVNKKKLEDGHVHLDTYLYKKHNTDSIQFLMSNNYYAANPPMYIDIYRMVQARLTKERKDVGKQLEDEQERRYSVQKEKKEARKNKKKDTVAKPKPKFTEVKSDG